MTTKNLLALFVFRNTRRKGDFMKQLRVVMVLHQKLPFSDYKYLKTLKLAHDKYL